MTDIDPAVMRLLEALGFDQCSRCGRLTLIGKRQDAYLYPLPAVLAVTDIDPAAVMAAHKGEHQCSGGKAAAWPTCEPYRLAEALAAMTKDRDSADRHADDWERNAEQAREALVAEQAKVARVQAVIDGADGWRIPVGVLDLALHRSAQPEQQQADMAGS